MTTSPGAALSKWLSSFASKSTVTPFNTSLFILTSPAELYITPLLAAITPGADPSNLFISFASDVTKIPANFKPFVPLWTATSIVPPPTITCPKPFGCIVIFPLTPSSIVIVPESVPLFVLNSILCVLFDVILAVATPLPTSKYPVPFVIIWIFPFSLCFIFILLEFALFDVVLRFKSCDPLDVTFPETPPLPMITIPAALCFKSILPTVPALIVTAGALVLSFVFNVKFFCPDVVIFWWLIPSPTTIFPVPFGEKRRLPFVPATIFICAESIPEFVSNKKFWVPLDVNLALVVPLPNTVDPEPFGINFIFWFTPESINNSAEFVVLFVVNDNDCSFLDDNTAFVSPSPKTWLPHTCKLCDDKSVNAAFPDTSYPIIAAVRWCVLRWTADKSVNAPLPDTS